VRLVVITPEILQIAAMALEIVVAGALLLLA
jgi:hypothetical protein